MTEQTKRTLKEFVQSQLETQGNTELEYQYFISTLSVGSTRVGEPYDAIAYNLNTVVHEVCIDKEQRFFQTFEYEIKHLDSVHVRNLPQPTLDNIFEVYATEVITRTFSTTPPDSEEV